PDVARDPVTVVIAAPRAVLATTAVPPVRRAAADVVANVLGRTGRMRVVGNLQRPAGPIVGMGDEPRGSRRGGPMNAVLGEPLATTRRAGTGQQGQPSQDEVPSEPKSKSESKPDKS